MAVDFRHIRPFLRELSATTVTYGAEQSRAAFCCLVSAAAVSACQLLGCLLLLNSCSLPPTSQPPLRFELNTSPLSSLGAPLLVPITESLCLGGRENDRLSTYLPSVVTGRDSHLKRDAVTPANQLVCLCTSKIRRECISEAGPPPATSSRGTLLRPTPR